MSTVFFILHLVHNLRYPILRYKSNTYDYAFKYLNTAIFCKKKKKFNILFFLIQKVICQITYKTEISE